MIPSVPSLWILSWRVLKQMSLAEDEAVIPCVAVKAQYNLDHKVEIEKSGGQPRGGISAFIIACSAI